MQLEYIVVITLQTYRDDIGISITFFVLWHNV